MRTLALTTLIAALAAGPGRPAALQAEPEGEGIRIHVSKRGLFSAFAHDHDLEVTRWHGTAELPDGDAARATLELVLDAGSLEEREHGLSAADRRSVEATTAGPEVLDAAAAPTITYRAAGATLEAAAPGQPVRGTLHGRLTLHGRTQPVEARFEASFTAGAWHVHGQARLRQSTFGIRPYRTMGGAVGVKDEVEVTFALALYP